MSNPNNCTTCDYTKLNTNREGHCYMFRDAPTDVCGVHTGRKRFTTIDEAVSIAAEIVGKWPDEVKEATEFHTPHCDG